MSEPRDLDEAEDMRAEKREALNRCPSCLRDLTACRCVQRCAECGGLTNHTTESHRAAVAAQGDDGP